MAYGFNFLNLDHPATSIETVNIPTPHLEKIWTYVCPLTKRRKVTCMAWNPTNKVIKLHINQYMYVVILGIMSLD